MIPSLAAAPQRRAYDHRLREHVCRTGSPALSCRLEIPRSTIATWRSLKHQWLYLNSLDTMERVRSLVAFFVDAHNATMPHAAFRGQTPDEMYFGTAPDLTADLADVRRKARELRLASNQGASCTRCTMPPESSAGPDGPP